MVFSDILYGQIKIPDWLVPFLKIPEFVRLRGVRLSNVDSYEFKDFNGPSRWEHCIGVAFLASNLAKKKGLNKIDSAHLQLAALLHDVATPPFAHTVEYVMEGYDHELESHKILSASNSELVRDNIPIYLSQVAKFRDLCLKISKTQKIKIDPDCVAEMVTGGGNLGFLINGSIDLDNIDNVIRASTFLGIPTKGAIALDLVDWLSGFDAAPSDLDNETNASVKTWLSYRKQMYSKFYSSHDEELGRQAFLQHLIRRSYKQGMSKPSIIWNTDEGLLYSIEHFSEKFFGKSNKNIFASSMSLEELVHRYRLLESTFKIGEIPIDNTADFKLAKNPAFASWLEDKLTTTTLEPFVIVNAKRFSDQNSLFIKEGGVIQIFKLGSADLKPGQLPEWISKKIPDNSKTVNGTVLNRIITEEVNSSLEKKPWLNLTSNRKENIKFNLENIGNWSFRLSRNEGVHTYPATFVHAIPATLINALCLKGETILDPFGGTGQTAIEAVKNGCSVISSDSNTIATMITKAKLSYLSKPQRTKIVSIEPADLNCFEANYIPTVNDIGKWHHKKTLIELSKILNFIESQEDSKTKLFYKVCFSDILTYCTARKGKEHGYFADNTPLSKGEANPPYEKAFVLFIAKVKKNIAILERFYSYFERNGLSIKDELSNAKVLQRDITKSVSTDFNIEPNSIAGIITSPPYLCMADYTLGQRLSYYWLFPEKMEEDFKNEIGPRRSRMKNGIALNDYFEDMAKFAENAASLLKENGFLATVVGTPVAKAYNENKILNALDSIFSNAGFELFWDTMRPIHWHRNHGYARLKEERIAVHIKKGT